RKRPGGATIPPLRGPTRQNAARKKKSGPARRDRDDKGAVQRTTRRVGSGDSVGVVPRSLHCATAEGAVAPVGMTIWGEAWTAAQWGNWGLPALIQAVSQ